jgi:uncharacterized ParB-like nuclease family protein
MTNLNNKLQPIEIKLGDINDPTLDTQFRVSGHQSDSVDRLVASIDAFGLKKPIAVEVDGGTKKYNIVDGHHRYFAFEKLGKTEIPAILVSFSSLYEREMYQWTQNEHDPVRSNDKATLEKFVRRMIWDHKKFGNEPSLADYEKIKKWVNINCPTHHSSRIAAVVKKALEGASALSSNGVKTYIAGSKELLKTISSAFDGKWKGSSIKSVDRGWCVQVVSQDSDATIKPGTALMMKSNTGAKALGVVYIGKTDGKTLKEMDDLRAKWINRLTGFNDYMKVNSSGRLVALDKIMILPQKPTEIRQGVKYLTYKTGKFMPVM